MLLNCSSEMSLASWPASAGCSAFHTPSTSHQALIEADGLAVQIGVSDNVHDRSCAYLFLRSFSMPSVCARAARYLRVKGKILSIDLPHELRAKFNGLFEFLFSLLL